MADQILTAEEVRNLLDYDPNTGIFIRKTSSGGCAVGTVSGSKHSKGYVVIKIRRKLYKAHRLAWLHFYGTFPNDQIDHIDGDKTNNRISNLRDVSAQSNSRNKKAARIDSFTGVQGVCYQKARKKYAVYISISGRPQQVGRFDHLHDAIAARKAAELLHYPDKPQ